MIRQFLETISIRKVLVEKFPQSFEEGCFGMEFILPKSKKKSELVVKLKRFSDSIFPKVKEEKITDKFGNLVLTFEPLEIQICASNDDNFSSDFLKWIDLFLKHKPYSGGANINFFVLNSSKSSIISFKGCSLKNVEYLNGLPTISISFFSYQVSYKALLLENQ